jgi:hypothetical protein
VERRLDQALARLEAVERSLEQAAVRDDLWYSRSRAACLLGVTTRTVDRKIRSGSLQSTRRDGHVFVSGKAILLFGQAERRPAVEVFAI